MTFKRIDEYQYLEFRAVVAEKAGKYKVRAFDKDGQAVAESDIGSREDAENQVKAHLREMSNEFFGMESAINLFLRVFPQGFETPLFLEEERTYKREASSRVQEKLSLSIFDESIAIGDLAELSQRIKSGIQATNLVSLFEKARFGDAIKKPDFQKRYARVLRDLLFDDHDKVFPEHVKVLKSEDALSWPLATYFPFLFYPQKHMFMKPEVMQTCARRLGFDLHYETPPTLTIYNSLLAFTDFVKEGIAVLKPESNIDIQSFLYVVGAPGYVMEVMTHKEVLDAG